MVSGEHDHNGNLTQTWKKLLKGRSGALAATTQPILLGGLSYDVPQT